MRSGVAEHDEGRERGVLGGREPDERRVPRARPGSRARSCSGSAPSPSCRRRCSRGCGPQSRSRPRSPARAWASSSPTVRSESTRCPGGDRDEVLDAVGGDRRLDRRGGTNSPPLATVLYASRICSGRHGLSRPDRDGAHRRTRPRCSGRSGSARGRALSPGQPRPVGWPKPRSLQEVREALGAEEVGDLDRPDVGRLGEDLGGGELLGRVVVGVVRTASRRA